MIYNLYIVCVEKRFLDTYEWGDMVGKQDKKIQDEKKNQEEFIYWKKQNNIIQLIRYFKWESSNRNESKV